ncbi:helix-turn-helix domain-containing protein [Streptosporangium sp. G11]|uniref:AraC-like ligand-binding domain-containing protein n=1 Tax=Streptosporangium sp. G11 TaxID=3436926 RepID=UPI003EC0C5C1
MTVTPRRDGPYAGRIAAIRCGYLRVLTVEADAQRACRTSRLISRSPRDFVVVGVQVSGTTTLSQDGRIAVVSPGDLVVFDTSRPYDLEHAEPVRMHLFQIPRRVLHLPDADVRKIVATTIRADSGYAALVALFLKSLAASAADCPPGVGERLAGQVADLLATLVTAATDHPAQTSGQAVVHRIRGYVEQHLSEQDLTPDLIAAAHHISTRYLYRLFEAEGITIGRWIQRRRLEECRRELAHRTSAALPIAVVAQRWGFVNAAHFSRAFRATYGMSPTTWRTIHSH